MVRGESFGWARGAFERVRGARALYSLHAALTPALQRAVSSSFLDSGSEAWSLPFRISLGTLMTFVLSSKAVLKSVFCKSLSSTHFWSAALSTPALVAHSAWLLKPLHVPSVTPAKQPTKVVRFAAGAPVQPGPPPAQPRMCERHVSTTSASQQLFPKSSAGHFHGSSLLPSGTVI